MKTIGSLILWFGGIIKCATFLISTYALGLKFPHLEIRRLNERASKVSCTQDFDFLIPCICLLQERKKETSQLVMTCHRSRLVYLVGTDRQSLRGPMKSIFTKPGPYPEHRHKWPQNVPSQSSSPDHVLLIPNS